MSTIRFGRGREYQFFRREDIRARWDLNSATQFLNRFRADSIAMAGFRRQVTGTGANGTKLTDDQVLQSVARLMVAGELIVALPQQERRKDELPSAPMPPPVHQERAAKPPAEIPEDEPTFSSDNDGTRQAAVLITAAATGVAFCEECARLAAEEEEQKKTPPKPVVTPPPPRPKRIEDPPTFPPEHDPQEQAAVLIEAAKVGAPFCEECARLQQEEQKQTPPPQEPPAPVQEEPNVEPTFPKNHDPEEQAAVLVTAAQTGTPFCEECERLAQEESKTV